MSLVGCWSVVEESLVLCFFCFFCFFLFFFKKICLNFFLKRRVKAASGCLACAAPPGPATPGPARPGPTTPGLARRVSAWPRRVLARPHRVLAWPCRVQPGLAGPMFFFVLINF